MYRFVGKKSSKLLISRLNSNIMYKQDHIDLDCCLVCGNTNLEKRFTGYSRYNPRLFHKLAICKDCGHIQQFPLFEDKEYEVINRRFFDTQYMINNQENSENNLRKLNKLKARISPYLKNNYKILDVGAGEAWAMNFFKKKRCDYFAIEAVGRLSKSIQDRGGEVIGKTIFANYTNYHKFFDIIIFRHILEHLLTPKEALLKLKNMLKVDGLIYLALPNSANPCVRKGFRTSFIRPVHISYFCEGNVIRIANDVGLNPIYSEAMGEIYCLLTHSKESDNYKYKNYYLVQKKVFEKKCKEAFGKDFIKIMKDIPKAILKKLMIGFNVGLTKISKE